MKILTLNTWGGRAGHKGLLLFVENYKNIVDIFCFQEMWSAPYEHLEGVGAGGKAINHNDVMVYGVQEFKKILDDYTPYFRPHHLENYGLLMFVHKRLEVIGEGEVFVYKEKGHELSPGVDVDFHARNVQFVTLIDKEGEKLTVCNFHGLWNGKDKRDSEDRIQQSEKILSFLKTIEGEIVFCGDFNLLPDTKSLQILEEYGLRNLIKEYKVTSTRTSLYTKPEKYADYILVSKDVKVESFEVLPDEVSDHSALSLVIA